MLTRKNHRFNKPRVNAKKTRKNVKRNNQLKTRKNGGGSVKSAGNMASTRPRTVALCTRTHQFSCSPSASHDPVFRSNFPPTHSSTAGHERNSQL